MIKLSYEESGQYSQKKFKFVVPECGHEITFSYTTPAMCSEAGCTSKVDRVSTLVGDHNMDVRVKYFVRGEL
jgi:hypothetical protein